MFKIKVPIVNQVADAEALAVEVKLTDVTTPNTKELINLYQHFIKRSYEGLKWYYVVFKPFNDSYELPKYGDCINRVSDHIRQKFKCSLCILSRETLSRKIHLNALVVANQEFADKHGSNVQCRGLKYKLHVQQLGDMQDRLNVLAYMFKEADERPFYLYTDHRSYDTNTKFLLGPCSAPVSLDSDDPDNMPPLKTNLFLKCCNNNKLKIII